MVLFDDLFYNTELPSLLYRATSFQVLLTAHALCRGFLTVFQTTTVNGGERFHQLLLSRSEWQGRKKGLLTVSNHISVLDDPLIWGSLPISFAAYHSYLNHRWTFGSHDLCFTNTPLSHFFTLGQVLPTHRIKHSVHGGLFQPTFTEGVRLLSSISADYASWNPHNHTLVGAHNNHKPPSWPHDAIDPFSPLQPYPPAFPSYPGDVRAYNQPSRYACNSYSWVHIFPEGFVHQSDPSQRIMRYFKWGVSRLILEPPEAPEFVPMFIEGTDQIMHESRTFPRFLPRIGKTVVINYGEPVDMEARFGDLRKRWRERVEEEYMKEIDKIRHAHRGIIDKFMPEDRKQLMKRQDKEALRAWYASGLGVVPESLKYDGEIVELRKECTRRVREEVLKVRRGRGYPDEDPKSGYAETWKQEGPKREGKMEDDTWVKDM